MTPHTIYMDASIKHVQFNFIKIIDVLTVFFQGLQYEFVAQSYYQIYKHERSLFLLIPKKYILTI